MTVETRRLIKRALDEALAMQVVTLFEGLIGDTSDANVAQFEASLSKAVDLHERLVDTLSVGENSNA